MQISRENVVLPPLGLLRRYLRVRGWSHRKLWPSGLSLYTLENDEVGTVEVVLPESVERQTDEERLFQAISAVSEVEDMPISEVFVSINGIGSDLILARLPNNVVYRETIKLSVAANFISRTRKILSSSATSESALSESATRSMSIGQDYADRCSFGHTFHGSFGFRIESPVGPHEEYQLDEVNSPPPFERKVVQRIARGISSVDRAVRSKSRSPIVEMSSAGLGADTCDELANLIENTHADNITFRFSFSEEWKSPSDIVQRRDLTLPVASIDLLRQAADELRTTPLSMPRTVSGRVRSLASKVVPSDLLSPEGREIVVDWRSEEWGDIRVRMRLTPAQYMLAFNAHPTGQHISVAGKLSRTGAGWRLDELEEFKLI